MPKLHLIIVFVIMFYFNSKAQELVTYHIEGLNDGYYQVSLIPHTTWIGKDAITASAQVTIKVGTSQSYNDLFTITDLTMLLPGVNWSQNSRYNAPDEEPDFDYISFGLDSKGTNNIPYFKGDTVPLFKFKNHGICNGDNVFLMARKGDNFEWPNKLNANVGQQLSVKGYKAPDVPLNVSGKVPCMAEVTFCFKALLQGPFNEKEGLMNDNLREKGLIPVNEPYANYQPIQGYNYFPFQHFEDGGTEKCDESIFKITGQDAIVDWVMIELRDQKEPKEVRSTRSALIQRDGDIVDMDGFSPVTFKKLQFDNYFFSVRHRNHLGLMSPKPYSIYNSYKYGKDCANLYDFSDLNTELYGETPGYNIETSGGKRLMWAGNSNADNFIMFQGGGLGEGLDIDNVFYNIISDPYNKYYSYNHVRNGYYPGDNNLDGYVKYQGPANDIDPFIFFNIMIRHPDNHDNLVNFYIRERLSR